MGKLRASSSYLVPNATLSALLKAGQGEEYAQKVLESMQAAQRAILSGEVASNGSVAQDWQRVFVADVELKTSWEFAHNKFQDWGFAAAAPVEATQSIGEQLVDFSHINVGLRLVPNFRTDDVEAIWDSFCDSDTGNLSLDCIASGTTMQEDEVFSLPLEVDEGPEISDEEWWLFLLTGEVGDTYPAHWDTLQISLVNEWTGQTIIKNLTFNFS